MKVSFARWAAWSLALAGAAFCAGCGVAGRGSMDTTPISVSLSNSTVVVVQGGMPVNVEILIRSTSETALVSVTGLPGGVTVAYASTDTNPSGTLTFTAGGTAVIGTFAPKVTVMSAGQTATTSFTLVVDK